VLQGLLYSRQYSGRAEAWRGLKKVKRKLRSYQQQETTRNMYMLVPCCTPFALTGENVLLPSVRLPGPRTFAVRFPLHLFALFGPEAIRGPIIC